MINLTKLEDVKALQNTLRNKPISDPDVMKFLEQICGWFNFSAIDTNEVLVMNGRRQIVAMLKTILENSPEVVKTLAEQIGV